MNIEWTCKPFAELTPHDVYDILQLRNEVFVVEQTCVFQDADGKDFGCHHLQGRAAGQLVAYTRLVPPGLAYAEASIGRVVTAPVARRNGFGRRLMEQSIDTLFALFGEGPIRIGAQLYLKDFYDSFGFVQQGEPYDEDGIPHIQMLRPVSS